MKKGLLLTGLAALILLPVWLRPYHFMPDDSFFYLQIAGNIAAGRGSTFNGIMETNGYHPLWMLLCVGVYLLTAGRSAAAVPLIVVLQQLLAAGAMLLCALTARPRAGRWAMVGAAGFGVYLLTGMFGSEAHLNAFLCALAIWMIARERPRGAARPAATGLVLGLGVLARLDNIFFLGGLGLYSLVRAWRCDGRISKAALLCFSAALPPALYLIFNWTVYGRLMPVSGAIKSTFPYPHWSPEQVSLLGRLVLLGALAGIATAMARKPRLWWLAAAALGVIAHAGYLAVFSRRFTWWSWYYVPGVLLGAITAAIAAALLERRWRRLSARPAAAMAVILLALAGGRAWIKAGNPDAIDFRNPLLIQPRQADTSWEMQMAHYLRDNLPSGSRILIWDLPGMTGFFSDHAVIPVDGLVGSYEFSDELLAAGAADYLRRKSVDYWVGPMAPPGECRKRSGAWRICNLGDRHEIEIFPPLYPHRSAGIFTVYPRDLLADLRQELDHPATLPIGVWQITDP